MRPVHLEGLGVIGCYLAHRLDADGVPFTWHDTDELVTAWRACTGAIFPTGHAEDQAAMAVWREHFDRQERGLAEFMEEADYVFSTARPPHQGRYEFTALAGRVKLGAERSLHLNAQRWVEESRRRFAFRRLAEPHHGAQLIVTHGFGARLQRFMWGWTVPVSLRVHAEHERRPCIYFREGRFTMAYAYPVPGEATWYAGSSLISQRLPKHLTVSDKFRRWQRTMLELGEGYVAGITPVGRAVEGWRPVPAEQDTAWLTRHNGALLARPLWHSGVRHAPHVYTALQEALA